VIEMVAELVSPEGVTDEFGQVHLTEDALILEGFFADSVGLEWAELARVLDHPFVKSKLEEADLLRG
jgi:hypothetical protein